MLLIFSTKYDIIYINIESNILVERGAIIESLSFLPLSNQITHDELKHILEDSLKNGDKIHLSNKNRKQLNSTPAVFRGIYNHFIRIETRINELYNTIHTISFSDIFTGITVIHELDDLIKEYKEENATDEESDESLVS